MLPHSAESLFSVFAIAHSGVIGSICNRRIIYASSQSKIIIPIIEQCAIVLINATIHMGGIAYGAGLAFASPVFPFHSALIFLDYRVEGILLHETRIRYFVQAAAQRDSLIEVGVAFSRIYVLKRFRELCHNFSLPGKSAPLRGGVRFEADLPTHAPRTFGASRFDHRRNGRLSGQARSA